MQIVVRELPFCPPAFGDLALVRVFIDPHFWRAKPDSDEGWVLRASVRLDNLQPVAAQPVASSIRPYAGRWELIQADYPDHEDLPKDFPEELLEDYYELGFENQKGTKVGGWPSYIQSEIFWAPGPDNPVYAFQIDSDTKAQWCWGDCGTAYFGRRTGAFRDKWAMTWQCY